MTEAEYQAAIRALMEEAGARGVVLLDYLVSQPPLRYGRGEIKGFTEWCLKAGAEHAEIIHERTRRQRLANKERDHGENL